MADVPLAVVGICITLLINAVIATRAITKSEGDLRGEIAREREARLQQRQSERDHFDAKIGAANLAAAEAMRKVAELQLEMTRNFSQHPTKAELREMFEAQLMPLNSRVDTLIDELTRRGIRSTAIHPIGDPR